MQHTGSRPLAPAPSSPTTPGDVEGIASPLQSHQVVNGIRRASTACQSCKQIKRKCDQAQPCSNCRKSDTQCIYNEAEDGRRKAARKRTVASLESKRDALDSILDSFRTSTDGQAHHLLRLIRENTSLEEVVQYATTHRGHVTRRQLDDIVSQMNEQPRKSVMSVSALCDTPLFQLPAQPWTSVTSNDELVSHLVSIFFTWYYPAYPTVDKELFLRDMAAGSLRCQYCSPLLVNAMLALACNFSDHPLTCRIPSDGSTRGQHFFSEATRLWAAEEAIPTLVNVQAASLLAVASCLVGKDRLSWSYVEQMNEMKDGLSLKHAKAQQWGLPPAPPESIYAEALVSETAFLLNVGYGIAFMKPSSRPAQLQQSSSLKGSRQKVTWRPYPHQLPETTYDFDVLHQAFCEVHRIGLEIQTLLYGSGTGTPTSELSKLDNQLTAWFASLPDELHVGLDSSVAKPPVIDLHLTYHFLRLTLFSSPRPDQEISVSEPARTTSRTFSASTSIHTKQPTSENPDVSLTAAEHDATSPPRGQDPLFLTDLQAKSLESAQEIARLTTRFGREYGLKQLSMWMPQAATAAAHCLIHLAIPLTDSQISGTFHELCSVMTAASRRWLVMKGHVRMLLMTADVKGQKMLPETTQLLRFVALDQWGDDDHKMFASSVFPNYALTRDGVDPRLSGMGDLLEMWASMQFTDESAAEEPGSTQTDSLVLDSRSVHR